MLSGRELDFFLLRLFVGLAARFVMPVCGQYRTAKVMIGQQTKFSDMVKGKQHEQAFDQTLEFVLAAGKHLLQLPPCSLLSHTSVSMCVARLCRAAHASVSMCVTCAFRAAQGRLL